MLRLADVDDDDEPDAPPIMPTDDDHLNSKIAVLEEENRYDKLSLGKGQGNSPTLHSMQTHPNLVSEKKLFHF